MATTFTQIVTESFVTETCFRCGVRFAVTGYFNDERHKHKDTFYCPNGHGQVYAGESDAQKLARERAAHDQTKAALRSEKANVEERDRKLALAAKKKAKLAERLKHGVCPCCQRTFKQLAAHMANKHPDYAVKN